MRPISLGAVIAVAATFVILGGYIGLQQHVRSDANHPQVEMAHNAAARLNTGSAPQSVVPVGTIDIGSSPDTYLIVLDSRGAILATSAQLGGAPVVPPSGVFDYVRGHGEDVISWQPAPGVRSAIVVDSFSGGFVVAGRSLKPAEDQVSALGAWAVGAWLLALVAAGAVALGVTRRS